MFQNKNKTSAVAADPLAIPPEWQNPIALLRKKWGTVPAGEDRQHSQYLLTLPDKDLLEFWDNSFCHDDDNLNIRGWYHRTYKDFMPGKKVLDIGCGLAFSSIPFAQMGAQLTFVDIISSNVEVVARLCKLKGISAEFMVIDAFSDLDQLSQDYDVVAAIGSLINAPLGVTRQEVDYLKKRLKPGGRWLHFAYPETRWIREGRTPFSEWGEKTDGPGTPWMEFHDHEKMKLLFAPTPIEFLFDCEWQNGNFNWFDLRVG